MKIPNINNQEKLGRTVNYLETTKYLPLILSMSDDNTMKWWVNASFVVHIDMKSRTRSAMSLGKGVIYSATSNRRSRHLVPPR